MAIEVREERPQERRFVVTKDMPGALYAQLTEPELRELVEKGASALGVVIVAADQYPEMGHENTRLRAWLKAIESDKGFEGACLKYMAARALAGEEAPKP